MQTDTKTIEISLTKYTRKNRCFRSFTTALTLFFFLSTFYLVPCAQAVDTIIETEQAKNQYHPQGKTDEEKLANTLQDIKENVSEHKAQVQNRVETESGLWQDFLNLFGLSSLANEDLDRLDSMAVQVELLNQKALQGFSDIEQDLIDKGLPEEILQRHYDTVDMYQNEYQSFLEKLQEAQAAESLQDQDSALGELDEFLDKQKFKRSQQPFDPDNMPFGTPDPEKTREPVTDQQELNDLLGLNTEPGSIEKMFDTVIPSAYAGSADGPTPADLEETIDVKITDAITELATQLNNNPVEIYNWVRNNIDFIPTYGSIQGSEATLESRQGNPFDTASLLIALLRASNIPAKYAYGNVSMPVDKVMNWVGGVDVPEAAQSILGQGGIPNLGRTLSGSVTHIELEHIWVEAWVDFEPSRGANNIEGESWVPLDASYKQYDYTDGLDIEGQVPFDSQNFADTIINNANIDEAAGSVQNIDQQFIQDQMTLHKQQVEDFISTQVSSDATMGDVLGTKTIREIDSPLLAAALPYDSLAISNRFSEIPNNLRHKYRLTLQDEYGWSSYSQTLDLPTLAGGTFALSFGPATPQDEQIVQAFIPENITDINQLPQSVPGYLIKLEAALVIDNTEQATGVRFQMGSEVSLNQALYSPQRGWSSTDSTIVAGEYHAIGVSGAGISAKQLERLQTEAENVQNMLEDCRDNQNCEPVRQLNKHQLLSSILQTGVLGWFAATQGQDRLTAQNQKIIYHPMPSFGKFSTSAKVQYSWGIPRNVSFPGVVMDIDFNSLLAETVDIDAQNRINFVKISGAQASAMEHKIPEKMFSTTQNPAEGISAVKALSIAAAQGQRIFTLTQNNVAQLNNISLDTNTRSEILNALYSGKEVVVHENPINEFGWTGTGYIILDPDTGSGAYMISGGANGGKLIVFGIILISLLFIYGAGAALATVAITLTVANFFLFALLGSIMVLTGLLIYWLAAQVSFDAKMTLLGITAGLGLLFFAMPVFAFVVSLIILIGAILGFADYLLSTLYKSIFYFHRDPLFIGAGKNYSFC